MIRTDLTDEELLLIRVIRLVEEDGEAMVSVDIRDKDGALKHSYIDTFDQMSEDDMIDAQKFIAHLHKYFPGIVAGKLLTYGCGVCGARYHD